MVAEVKSGGKMFFHDREWEGVDRPIKEAELVGEVLFPSVFMAIKE